MKANLITMFVGFALGALIASLILKGFSMYVDHVSDVRLWLSAIVIGGAISLFLGSKSLAVGELGALTVFDAVQSARASTGLYFELPGIVGIIKVSAKLVGVQVVIQKPKLKDNVTLNNAKALVNYIVVDPYKAALITNLAQFVDSLSVSAVRRYLMSKDSMSVESVKVDLLPLLGAVDPKDKSVFLGEAEKAGIEIRDLYLESADIPEALEKARNQKIVEGSEREAQEVERAFRDSIIAAAMAKGASFAEAASEADKLTGKGTTLSTTQITGTRGAQPVVVVGNNLGGGSP